MRCLASAPVLLLLALLLGGGEARAGGGGPGPGRPIWPQPGQKDCQLYEKAMRIQARMWRHLSPEGLLVEIHRSNATPAQLSHDAIALGDAAIWTGCYAASQAARWHVTRDPDALAQVRHLARGLAALTAVTGQPGCLSRSVGRPIPGETAYAEAAISPTGSGLRFRSDASRDQLSGITLGWALIGHWVDDPEIRALARAELKAIAIRLWHHGMWIVDYGGKRTEYGELRADVRGLPFVRNGPLASIGLAAIVVGSELNPECDLLRKVVRRLCDKEEWDRALSEQHTFFASFLSNTNVNMVTLSLLALALSAEGNASYRAGMGMKVLRRASVGWWNAGICACYLLGNSTMDRRPLIGEIRATLHAMPEQDAPPARYQRWLEREIVPIQHRSIVSGWAWKEAVCLRVTPQPASPLDPNLTNTRADFLFAYWIARAAGALQPREGPGVDPKAHRCPVVYPPWMAGGSPPGTSSGSSR